MVTSAVFDAAAAARQVVAALLPQADSERAGQARRYLNSDLDFLGVSVPAIRSAVRDVARTRRELDRDGALAWARALWREPVHERRTAAIEVLRWYIRRLLPADLALVEAWVREAHGPAETVTAVRTLENRLATGRWHVPSPAAMNARAAALGPQLNIFSADGAVAATPPAFLSYSPARYLRPFNLFP
jgi:hypothetical protein